MPASKHAIEFEEIAEMSAESVEAGIPVFKAETRAGSYLTFAFPRTTEGMGVYHVVSNQRGDFKRLMDATLAKFNANNPMHVTFFNVVTGFMDGRDLDDVLTGFARETRTAQEGPGEGQAYDVLIGEWEPRGRHLD